MDVNIQIVLLRIAKIIWTKAKNPLRSVILHPPFHWIGKTMAFKIKVFKNVSHSCLKKQNSLSSPNLKDYFDTKIDPPHEI